MGERVSRTFLEGQVGRVGALVPGGVQLVLEGGTGWTVFRVGDADGGKGWFQVAYGRTKGELSAILDGVEMGLRLAGVE